MVFLQVTVCCILLFFPVHTALSELGCFSVCCCLDLLPPDWFWLVHWACLCRVWMVCGLMLACSCMFCSLPGPLQSEVGPWFRVSQQHVQLVLPSWTSVSLDSFARSSPLDLHNCSWPTCGYSSWLLFPRVDLYFALNNPDWFICCLFLTWTCLWSFLSPNEDSCQKFIPFIGVSGAIGCTPRLPGVFGWEWTFFFSSLVFQMVKVGFVEQSSSASGQLFDSRDSLSETGSPRSERSK